MLERLDSEVRDLILKYVLKNAIEHGGKAAVEPVMSKLLGLKPELRPVARDLSEAVAKVVAEVNQMSVEEQVKLAKEKFPEVFEERVSVEKPKVLPPLPNVERYKEVRTRFAPNPDFLIHLGNARPAILSYEYARMYNGKLILRFEDTDPKTKKPLLEAYKAIREDLNWLGVKWDEEYIQSLRMEIYYSIARELISLGGAYVDLCTREEFIKYKLNKIPCPHRETSAESNLELWDKMLANYFTEGEAVLRVKTDLNHPDPSVRDWVAFRIIDTDKNPHPLVGSRYVVWPTYNYAAAVDDHLLNITHILRGKEHMVNTLKQRFLYNHLGWEYPEVIHLGRLRLEGLILSKSKIKELLMKHPEDFSTPDDVRFGTLAALRRRGVTAEAIRKLILEVGVKGTDAVISWDNIASTNRKLLDYNTKRLMFVQHPPTEVIVRAVPSDLHNRVSIPLHPSNKSLGSREVEVIRDAKGGISIFISKDDVGRFKEVGYIRLMEFINIKYVDELNSGKVLAEYVGKDLNQARRLKAPIVQWVPSHNNVRVVILKPEGLKIKKVRGYGEEYFRTLQNSEVVQLVRFGFAKVEEVSEGLIKLIYIHE